MNVYFPGMKTKIVLYSSCYMPVKIWTRQKTVIAVNSMDGLKAFYCPCFTVNK
jgi:hypothetical protein